MAGQPTSSTEKVKLGACRITYDGVDLGLTKGGVEVEVATETLKVTVDQFGTTTISELVQGRNVTVTAPLAESDLERLVLLMPGSTLSAAGDEITIMTGAGLNLVTLAKELVLTPLDGSDFVLTLPKAATAGNFTMAYKHDDVRVYSTQFSTYPDDTGLLGKMTKRVVAEETEEP